MSNIVNEIIFVSGIDPALIGIKINGYELKCSKSTPLPGSDDNLSPIKRVFDLGNTFLGLDRISGQGFSYLYEDDGDSKYFLYFQKVLDLDCRDSHFETQHLINCLRLFQNSKIGFFCPLSVNSEGGCIAFSDIYHSFHSVWSFEAPNFNDNGTIQYLNSFYSDTYQQQYTGIVTKMLHLFHDSFRMHTKELKLIQRVTILEMLIEGNIELTNRLSRSVAVFLGRNLDESRTINLRMKQIYTARSKYLHDGNAEKIDSNLMLDTLDLSRRVIVNLLYIKDDIKAIREKIDESGFGTNPFNVWI